jgi:hypothetical protein
MYLAKFEKTIQVSEDEWRVVWIEKLFEENTPISEIATWTKKQGGYAQKPNGDKTIHCRGVVLTEPDI